MDERLLAFAEDAIRTYLSARPHSADTLDGIHRWWIHWPEGSESQVVTEIALERLEAAGEMERFRIGDSVVWRRRNAQAGES